MATVKQHRSMSMSRYGISQYRHELCGCTPVQYSAFSLSRAPFLLKYIYSVRVIADAHLCSTRRFLILQASICLYSVMATYLGRISRHRPRASSPIAMATYLGRINRPMHSYESVMTRHLGNSKSSAALLVTQCFVPDRNILH